MMAAVAAGYRTRAEAESAVVDWLVAQGGWGDGDG
jgi:hypothetical protein